MRSTDYFYQDLPIQMQKLLDGLRGGHEVLFIRDGIPIARLQRFEGPYVPLRFDVANHVFPSWTGSEGMRVHEDFLRSFSMGAL